MTARRPVNLNFATIRFPIMAWVSIAHRLSGVGLFFLIPGLLWLLQESLASEARWSALKAMMQRPIVVCLIWVLMTMMLYHSIAGIRHLGLDVHVGETKRGGRMGAWLVIGVTVLLSLLIGYWLW